MATTGSEMWLQWFACCIQPAAQAQRTRRRIDRSMIGAPTNFQHTGHIAESWPRTRSTKCEGKRDRLWDLFSLEEILNIQCLQNALENGTECFNTSLPCKMLGSTDVDMPSSLLHSIQNQMQSKGGYEMAYGVKVY